MSNWLTPVSSKQEVDAMDSFPVVADTDEMAC